MYSFIKKRDINYLEQQNFFNIKSLKNKAKEYNEDIYFYDFWDIKIWKKLIKKFLLNLYNPTSKSVLKISVLYGLGVLINNSIFINSVTTSNFYNNKFFNINIAFVSLIIAIFIFITKEIKEKIFSGEVELKKSFIFPIVIFEIYNLLIIFSGLQSYTIINTYIIGISLIYSVFKLIEIYINKSKYDLYEREIINDKFKMIQANKNILNIADKILKIYFNKKSRNIKNPELIKSSFENSIVIKSKRQGKISDINLKKLSMFIKKVNKCIELNTGNKDKNYEIKFNFKFNKKLNHNKNLIELNFENSEKYRNKIIKMWERNNPLKIKSGRNDRETITYEFNKLYERIISAFINDDHVKIQNILKKYNIFIDNILKSIYRNINIEKIQNKKHSIERLFHPKFNDELEHTISKIYSAIIRNNKYFILTNDFKNFILENIYKSITYLNPYYFKSFLDYLIYFYLDTHKNNNNYNYTLDLFFRRVEEIYNFIISRTKRKDINLTKSKDFIVSILQFFKKFIRYLYDRNGYEILSRVFNEMNTLFQKNILKIINYSNIENSNKECFKNYENIKNNYCFNKIVMRYKNQLLFGMSSYFNMSLNKYKCKKDKTVEDIHKIVNTKKILNKIIRNEGLLNIDQIILYYKDYSNRKIENFWGFSNWENFDSTGWGRLYIHDYYRLTFLIQIYFIKMKQNNKKIPYDDFIAKNADRLVNDIKNNEEYKKTVKEILKIEKLDKKLIENIENEIKDIKDNYKKRKEKELKKKPISEKKVKEFKKNMYNEYSSLRKIKNIFNNIKRKKDEQITITGITQAHDKKPFVEVEENFISNIGEVYGRGLAEMEDKKIISDICRKSKSLNKQVTNYNELKNLLNQNNINNNFICLTKYQNLYELKDNCEMFKQENMLSNTKGKFELSKREINIYFIPQKFIRNDFLFINLENIKFIQYEPLNKNESIKKKINEFYVDIQAFSENEKLMKQLLKDKPDWLVKKGSERDQKEHLKQKVWIKIFERFDIKIIDKNKTTVFFVEMERDDKL
ncbi:MAG: hypothetical protein FXF47_02920 [Candidatus Mcinerneyibacterium aminivorans]|uniref:Uncharacterized protein n=1 Tax=Candidatus Mcinerneyibacterium aminivorans TaxID=2703815 RepID=A0A5D0MGM6_9BACT|nr:MAG: hypothetical protein FXF47_02920 [Candidatus Mcinerneyibacterium aminivorans]